jgi:hypothetical protein
MATAVRAAQIGLVYCPRLPSKLTTAIADSHTRHGGPCRNVRPPTARMTVIPPR